MNPSQQAKLKSLIQTTTVLDTKEKHEWTVLLDVMDDKQAFELQKILESASALPKFETGAVSNSSVYKQNLSTLHLSHILNAPAVGINQFELPSQEKLTNISSGLPGSVKKTSSFFSKLKDILAEKKLSPGHPNPMEQLELEDSVKQEKNIKLQGENVGNAGHDTESKKGEINSISAAKLSVPLKQKKLVSNDSTTGKSLSVSSEPAYVHFPEKIKDTARVKLPEFSQKTQQVAGINSEVTPANIAKALLKEKSVKSGLVLGSKNQSGITDQKDENTTLKNSFKPSLQKIAIGINSAQDIAKITATDFEKSDFNELVQRLKKIALSEGIHKILFSLEQSPLFKSYINTGINILQKRASFSNQHIDSEGLLGQENFENFVDLLMEIQAG